MTNFQPTPQGIYDLCASRFPLPVTPQTAFGWLVLYKEWGCGPDALLKIAASANSWRQFQAKVHRAIRDEEMRGGSATEKNFGKLVGSWFDNWAKRYPDDPAGCGPALVDYVQNQRWKEV